MNNRTGDILFSIGLLFFAAGNYCIASSVFTLYNEVNSLNREVNKLNRNVRDLYIQNDFYQTQLSDLEKKISPQEDISQSEEVIEIGC